jgi:hypothetical protein
MTWLCLPVMSRCCLPEDVRRRVAGYLLWAAGGENFVWTGPYVAAVLRMLFGEKGHGAWHFGLYLQRKGDALHALPDNFSSRITRVVLGAQFNGDVSALAGLAALRHLTFGSDFDGSVDAALTNKLFLRTLRFGDAFNREFGEAVSLPSLEVLALGQRWNRDLGPIASWTSLRVLKFGARFHRDIDQLSSLQELQFIVFGMDFRRPVLALVPLLAPAGALHTFCFYTKPQTYQKVVRNHFKANPTALSECKAFGTVYETVPVSIYFYRRVLELELANRPPVK